jgi:hypothetical protein
MGWSGENAPLKLEISRAKISGAQGRCWTVAARLILGIEACECKRAGLWMLGRFVSCRSDPDCPRKCLWTLISVSGYPMLGRNDTSATPMTDLFRGGIP